MLNVLWKEMRNCAKKFLDERARELAFEEVRWFDIVRWKRADVFKKELHGLDITIADGSLSAGNLKLNFPQPKVESVSRYWQDNFSPKWYMSAFPSNEINKGYGLLQNPDGNTSGLIKMKTTMKKTYYMGNADVRILFWDEGAGNGYAHSCGG